MEDNVDLNPDYWNADGSPKTDTSSGGVASGSGWQQLGSSLFNAGGNVLTQALKNQVTNSTLGKQLKLAQAQQTNSSSTLKIVIIAVVGLVAVGLAFAFLKKSK